MTKKKNPSILNSLGIGKPKIKVVPRESKLSVAEERILLINRLSQTQGSRELLTAARTGDLAKVEYLLNFVPSTKVNFQSSSSEDVLGKGATALHFAALNDHPQVIEALLRFSANPLLTTQSGLTPLHIAAKRGAVGAVKTFLVYPGNSALVAAKDNMGRTALSYAQKEEVARLLKRKTSCVCLGIHLAI